MPFQVQELLEENGSSPYADWFQSLDPIAAAKISVAKIRMEQGNLSNVKWLRGIGEYRIDWGPGYRIYLAKGGEKVIVLLGGGTKKGQQEDIERSIQLWESYKKRKARGTKRSS
jgi:putative addiction module killer protein